MPGDSANQKYDLAERTEKFARDVRIFVRKVRKTLENSDDLKQLLRSSGSIGANYIEAEEFVGDKDFIFRMKLCRKESKESAYFLRLLEGNIQNDLEKERMILCDEATQLTRIFGSIVTKKK